MTQIEKERTIQYIKNQLDYGYVDLGCHDEDEIEIIRQAINALGLIDQYKWERDIAICQLEELGLGLGQKIDGVYLTHDQYNELLECKYRYESLCD
ncbi:hypothetical protein [Bariatricus sp. SGI.019]|uniref:hypothetical protein n=1 Tax=Bariatricus sp. SGI.019 TaxID=3420548 RepID=UPI003D0052FB